jgi:hypothetical protein
MPSPVRQLAARTLTFALLALVSVPGGASAAGTLYVDSASNAPAATCGSSAEPCETIGDAVARATGGEEILVAPGDYPGATIMVPVHLRGAQAGMSGPARGIGSASRTSSIRGTLVLEADATIDGFEFAGITSGPAIRFDAPRSGVGRGAASVINNTFSGIGGSHVARASSRSSGLSFVNNLFVAADGGARIALYVHGEHLAGGIDDVVVERNEFRGFSGADAAALDMGGVPGLHVLANTAAATRSFLVLADTNGATDRVRIRENVVSSSAGPAIQVGGGVTGVTLERNELRDGSSAAIRVSSDRGTGPTSDMIVRANDITGFAGAVHAAGESLTGAIILRGNRLMDIQRAGWAIRSESPSGTIDARRNWWGRNTGLPTASFVGSVDASEPLQLLGLEVPASVLIGGSGVAAVRLATSSGATIDPDAAGFPVTFSTTAATLVATQIRLDDGRASTRFTAGTTPGSTTTTATLDDESLSASTRIVSTASEVDSSPAADVSPLLPAWIASSRVLERTLPDALRIGFRQHVSTNIHASVRTDYFISHYDARVLGLRPHSATTREPFLIARVRTRPIRGSRIVTARINPRPAWALARTNRRIAVQVVSLVRTGDGRRHSEQRRIVLPPLSR